MHDNVSLTDHQQPLSVFCQGPSQLLLAQTKDDHQISLSDMHEGDPRIMHCMDQNWRFSKTHSIKDIF
jgi:hypothetical protein